MLNTMINFEIYAGHLLVLESQIALQTPTSVSSSRGVGNRR
jgi:hypothetical protein